MNIELLLTLQEALKTSIIQPVLRRSSLHFSLRIGCKVVVPDRPSCAQESLRPRAILVAAIVRSISSLLASIIEASP